MEDAPSCHGHLLGTLAVDAPHHRGHHGCRGPSGQAAHRLPQPQGRNETLWRELRLLHARAGGMAKQRLVAPCCWARTPLDAKRGSTTPYRARGGWSNPHTRAHALITPLPHHPPSSPPIPSPGSVFHGSHPFDRMWLSRDPYPPAYDREPRFVGETAAPISESDDGTGGKLRRAAAVRRPLACSVGGALSGRSTDSHCQGVLLMGKNWGEDRAPSGRNGSCGYLLREREALRGSHDHLKPRKLECEAVAFSHRHKPQMARL